MIASEKRLRILLAGTTIAGIVAACLLATGSARAQQGPNAGLLFGGVLGAMGRMALQAQEQQLRQQQLQQQQLLYQQQLQQQQAQQQQEQAQRNRAAAEAQERANQRQQAEADAIARQKQAQARAAADAKAKADARERQSREAANKLRADPALASLLGPDSRDITTLIVGQDTQNVIRNLKGDPVFQNGAAACLPFGGAGPNPSAPEPELLQRAKQEIERKGGLTDTALVLTNCEPADLASYDLIMFSRAQVAAGTAEVLAPLVDLLRKRRSVPFATYTFAQLQAEEAARLAAARAEEARQAAEQQAAVASFQTRDPSAISGVHIASPAAVACIISSPDAEGLRYLLKRDDSPFAAVVRADSAIRDVADADAVFIALKRQDCLAAIAPAGVLKAVMAGLARDGIKTEVDKGQIATDRLAGWKALLAQSLATEQEQQAKDLAAQRQKQTEQTADATQTKILEERRRANDEAARREELERMRKLVASKASAVTDAFRQKLRKHMESVEAELLATQQRAKLGQVLSAQQDTVLRVKYAADRVVFPPWSAEFETLVKQGWEFGEAKVSVEDYGRAQWRSRTIEAVAVRAEFPMVQREIGEKRVDCYDFVWINDEEFQYIRQAAAAKCDEYDAAFAVWAEGNQFVSQWKLLQPE